MHEEMGINHSEIEPLNNPKWIVLIYKLIHHVHV